MAPYGDGRGPAGLGRGTGRGRGGCMNRNRQNTGVWRSFLNMFCRPKSAPVLSSKGTITGRRDMFAMVDMSRCTRCGICIDVCPVLAISYKNDGTAINREVCIGCGQCVHACPKDAIYLKER